MTAYQPERWHDMFMAGAAAALGMPVCRPAG